MIKTKARDQYSLGPMIKVKGCCIHNSHTSLSARETYNQMIESNRAYSAHKFIDKDEVINALPLTVTALHTGKANDKGNLHTIAYEICASTCSKEDFMIALDRCMKEIIKDMKRFRLNWNQIYFHNDFDINKYCPHAILDMFGTREAFLLEMRKKYDDKYKEET